MSQVAPSGDRDGRTASPRLTSRVTPRLTLRLAIGAAGVGLMLWGGLRLLTGGAATHWVQVAVFLAVLVAAHDGLFAPVLVLLGRGAGWLESRWGLSGRGHGDTSRAPRRVVRPVHVVAALRLAAVIGGSILLVWLVLLRGPFR